MDYPNVAAALVHYDALTQELKEGYTFKWWQFIRRWRARKKRKQLVLQITLIKPILAPFHDKVLERARKQYNEYLVASTPKEKV